MRRKDREIADRAAMEAIIRSGRVCHLAMSDGGQPYVVPLSYGYRDGVLYLHGAPEGRKIDVLKRNAAVCFDIVSECELVSAPTACGWSMKYRSVIGFGTASFVADADEKAEALGVVMRQYSTGTFAFPPEAVAKTTVIRVDIQSMTGKQRGTTSHLKPDT
jgi:uncharacterized protein